MISLRRSVERQGVERQGQGERETNRGRCSGCEREEYVCARTLRFRGDCGARASVFVYGGH